MSRERQPAALRAFLDTVQQQSLTYTFDTSSLTMDIYN
jgi:hypothetical protein